MVYHVLADGTAYREAGADYDDRHHSQRVSVAAFRHLLGGQILREQVVSNYEPRAYLVLTGSS